MRASKTERILLLFAGLLLVLGASCRAPLVLIPGGALEGTTVEAPSDWSSIEDVHVIQLETNPEKPYSVNLWVVSVDQILYVHSGNSRTTWVENMEANPRVKLQAQGAIYELVASRVESQDEFDRFIEAYALKYETYPRNPVIDEVYLYRLIVPGTSISKRSL